MIINSHFLRETRPCQGSCGELLDLNVVKVKLGGQE